MTKVGKNSWIRTTILEGNKLGQTIGFPTINLDPSLFPTKLSQGVYAANIRYKQEVFKAALYFGPRLVLGETGTVLEIHIINFAQNIYGKSVEFIILDFIRPPLNFSSLAELKKQLQKDIENIKVTL